jgi:hypothetical protein
MTLPFPNSNYIFHLLLKELFPPISCEPNQPRPRSSMVVGSGTGVYSTLSAANP